MPFHASTFDLLFYVAEQWICLNQPPGSFPLVAAVTSVKVNVISRIFRHYTPISVRTIPRSQVALKRDVFIFHFAGYCQIAFQNGIIYIPHTLAVSSF